MWKSIKSMLLVLCSVLVMGSALEVLTAQMLLAQGGGNTVKGVVTDASGPVIGATVVTKEGSNGATTGLDGSYTLNNVKKGETLEFSFLGYKTEYVVYNGQTVIDVNLKEDAIQAEAVVVTALGIKRQEKTLSYNVQQVKSDEINTVKDANFMNSLVGKVAGVTINSGAAGPGAASRVVMRGVKSLNRDNNALYVIDGMPMFDVNAGGKSDSQFASQASSDAVADINPEDIESVNLLTGPSAAALYGNIAANGVVLINTRKGSVDKTTLTVSNNTTFSTAYMMPRMQNYYSNKAGEFMSWGDRMESGSYDPKSFFNTGANIINSVTFSTGTKRNQTYASVSTTNASGILPNNSYDRYNFSMKNTASFLDDKLTLDLGGNYIIQHDKNMVSQGQYFNPLLSLYLFPRGDNFDEIRMYERFSEGFNFYKQYWPYGDESMSLQNPYWIMNRMVRENSKKRYMFNAGLTWKINDWINLSGRAKVDNSDIRMTDKRYASTSSKFAGTNGGYADINRSDRSFYGDVMLNIDKRWDNFSLSANIGASIRDLRYEEMGYQGNLSSIPNFFTIRNLIYGAEFKPKQFGYHDMSQSVFANVEFGWKNMLFLTVTGRNDWESQLAGSAKSSFFYPSVGVSGIISQMAKLPQWVSLLKVRASYAQVGASFDRFLTMPTYAFEEQKKQWNSSAKFPAFDLLPEDTKSWEVGLNLKLWNKFSLDFTYYRSNTYNQTFNVTLPSSSGFSTASIQTGNIMNQGIEVALGYNNKWGDFTWSTNYTLTSNQNKVISLASGAINPYDGQPIVMDRLEAGSFGTLDAKLVLTEGGTMGDVWVTHALRQDSNGNIWVDSQTGDVQIATVEDYKIGSILPKANMGWSNNFSYKGLDLGIVLTARIGGIALSETESILDRNGVSQASADARDMRGIPINNGFVDAQQYYSTVSGYGAYYAYSATNVRLQELSLSYNLPRKWFKNKMGMTVGFVARNLWMIYCKAPFDPEMATSSTNTFYQSFDYFMQPSMRNIGFNVKLQF